MPLHAPPWLRAWSGRGKRPLYLESVISRAQHIQNHHLIHFAYRIICQLTLAGTVVTTKRSSIYVTKGGTFAWNPATRTFTSPHYGFLHARIDAGLKRNHKNIFFNFFIHCFIIFIIFDNEEK